MKESRYELITFRYEPIKYSDRVGVDGICARDLDGPQAITHSNVLALADYDESDFLQCSDCCQMINAGQLRHAARR